MNSGHKKPPRVLARDKSPDAQSIKARLDRVIANQSANVFTESHEHSPSIPILIVEDQPLMRKAFKRVLEPTHMFTVQEAHNPKDAIQYLRNHAIDLVILDLYLSKGNGLEVLNYIRSRPIANDIPVVFVTGEASRDDIVHAIELGVNDYILKPFEPQDLLLKIRQVMSRYVDPPPNLKRLREAENMLLQGMLREAHQEFMSLRSIDPYSPRVIVGLAHAEWKLGQNQIAKDLIEEAIRLTDMCFPAYALMADMLISEGKKHEAVEFLLRELSLNGKRSGRRVQLAELYFEVHDYRSGLEQVRLALIDFPNDEALLLKMASMQLECGDNEKSLHYYLKTRRNVPRSSQALKGIMDVCFKMKNGKKALQIFTDFLKQKAQQADVLHARAQVYERMDMLDEAIADIESSLLLEPDQTDPLTTKGRLLKKTGQEMPARMVWASLTRIDPSAANMTQVGIVNFLAGDFAQAALYFERAIFAESNHHKALYHLALCYKKLGQVGKAKSICQQALALLPQNSEFKKLLGEISGNKEAGKKDTNSSYPRAG
jgi:DNA-binding response OmpR family regulator